MRLRLQWLAGLVILFTPLKGSGCEPIFPLVQLLGGSTLAGPLWLTHSLFWLAVAVTIKCGVFVCLERRLPWYQAVLYMVVANVLSTIPGFIVAVGAGSLSGIVVAVPLVFVLGRLVE